MEAYGAYALGTWLSSGTRTSARTRRYAMWSAIGSLLLGMAGQVAYHLMSRGPHHPRALGHHHRGRVPARPAAGHGRCAGPHAPRRRQRPARWGIPRAGPATRVATAARTPRAGTCPADLARTGAAPPGEAVADDFDCIESERLEVARLTAIQLTSTGLRISRRNLREAGLRGSNADLGALVRAVSADLDRGDRISPAAPDYPARATSAATPSLPGST